MEPDADIKAYVAGLVSSLGGIDYNSEDHSYKVGVEGLACLRDIRKWLLSYDEAQNKLDVARAVAETTLVTVDIPEILANWERECRKGSASPVFDRVALSCLELLVPLLWPVKIKVGTSTENQVVNAPYIARAQSKYKYAILTHPNHSVLRAVQRLAVNALTSSENMATAKDQGVLKLSVYFFKNLLEINSAPGLESQLGFASSDINKSATVTEFQNQNVLKFLVSLAANTASAVLDAQTLPLMECFYALLLGVDTQDLFSSKTKAQKDTGGLAELLETEKSLRKAVFTPTRHTRFGTMVSVGTGTQSHVVASGQQALASTKTALGNLDNNKKWRRARRNTTKECELWDVQYTLDDDASDFIRKFVQQFLDSSFSPFFSQVRELLAGDVGELNSSSYIQYLYLLGWFLRAEKIRHGNTDFQLVAEALDHRTFVLVTNLMYKGDEPGPHRSSDLVHAGMMCCKELISTIEEMGASPLEEWSNAAESIKSRVFYDEQWLDFLIKLPRASSGKSLSYACDCLELTHVVFKALEAYSSRHSYMYVKAKRRKARTSRREDEALSGEEDSDETSRPRKERQFNFVKFEESFLHEETLDMYERVLSNFREVQTQCLKHVLAFYHRFFVKRGTTTIFFRLSLINLLLKVTQRSDGLKDAKLKHLYQKFTDYYASKLLSSLEEHPSLFIEVLFDKLTSETYYFEHGHDQETSHLKPAGYDFEFKDPSMSLERQFAVTVAALSDEEKHSFVKWVSNRLPEVIEVQLKDQWRQVFTSDHKQIRMILRSPLCRLLMQLLGCVFEGGKYIIPQTVSASELVERGEYIAKYLEEPVAFENNQVASNYLKSQVPLETRDSDESSGEDQFDNPMLQPLSAEELAARKLVQQQDRAKAKARPKKRTRRAVSDSESESEAPKEKPKDKAPRVPVAYKSTAFVHASDDESDPERDAKFFSLENELRQSVFDL